MTRWEVEVICRIDFKEPDRKIKKSKEEVKIHLEKPYTTLNKEKLSKERVKGKKE